MIRADILENGSILINERTVSDSVKFETIRFSFPCDWECLEKTAVFKNDDTAVSIVLNSDNEYCVSENECYIPFEVLNPPEFTVSVFGIKDGMRATTARGKVQVIESGYEQGDQPLSPTPDEYSQILSIATNANVVAQSVRDDVDSGKISGEKGDKGDKGDTGDTGPAGPAGPKGEPFTYEDFTDEQLEALKGPIGPQGIQGIQGEKGDTGGTYTKAEMLNMFYPVGSIYMAYTNINPSTLFGGTWTQIKDSFLLAAGNTYSAGSTGGEAVHTLKENEIPSHNHGSKSLVGYMWNIASQSDTNNLAASGIVSTDMVEGHGYAMNSTSGVVDGFKIDATHTHNSFGGGKSHNNMPPYLAVYMWKRTA